MMIGWWMEQQQNKAWMDDDDGGGRELEERRGGLTRYCLPLGPHAWCPRVKGIKIYVWRSAARVGGGGGVYDGVAGGGMWEAQGNKQHDGLPALWLAKGLSLRSYLEIKIYMHGEQA